VYDLPTQNAVIAFKLRHLMGGDSILDTQVINRIFDEYESIISIGE